MKTIRSNKKGFAIHSPFVYNLVTSVLFVKSEVTGFEDIVKLNLGKRVNKQCEKLIRLLNYFSPKTIYTELHTGPAEIIFLKIFNSSWVINEIKSGFTEPINLSFEDNNAFFLLEKLPDIDLMAIQWGYWFIRNKPDKKEIKLKLLPLMEKKRGIILIEFYYDAFIIFDEKFPSQHYVIK